MSNPGFIKTYTADGAIAARRIVKYGSADGLAAQASAVGDAILGVSERLAAADGERIDIVKSGLVDVEYGGVIAAGDPLTADADGKAIAAAPAAGVNNSIVGFAEIAGVAGDYGKVNIALGRIQG